MKEQKRVQLTHGSARVDKDCSQETINALDEISKRAYKMEGKSFCKCEKPKYNYPEMLWCDNCVLEINQSSQKG